MSRAEFLPRQVVRMSTAGMHRWGKQSLGGKGVVMYVGPNPKAPELTVLVAWDEGDFNAYAPGDLEHVLAPIVLDLGG